MLDAAARSPLLYSTVLYCTVHCTLYTVLYCTAATSLSSPIIHPTHFPDLLEDWRRDRRWRTEGLEDWRLRGRRMTPSDRWRTGGAGGRQVESRLLPGAADPRPALSLPVYRPFVLYCTVLYCTVLYCTVLYSTLLYSTLLYSTLLYCTLLYCTVLYCEPISLA